MNIYSRIRRVNLGLHKPSSPMCDTSDKAHGHRTFTVKSVTAYTTIYEQTFFHCWVNGRIIERTEHSHDS
ncbi:MAG: hypothetical protein HRU34_09635 [Richelia sp.]|nr:hypothetical protein [Richelia sp.]